MIELVDQGSVYRNLWPLQLRALISRTKIEILEFASKEKMENEKLVSYPCSNNLLGGAIMSREIES